MSSFFSGQEWNANSIVDKALSYLKSFQNCVDALRGDFHHNCGHPLTWLPPDAGWLMLNIDTSYGNDKKGLGFVLRDCYGHVMMSGAGPLGSVISAEHAETLAVWYGLLQYRTFGLNNL